MSVHEWREDDIGREIMDLKTHGSSLIMNWGEDTGCWEVSWITGGERFTAVGPDLAQTLASCRMKAYTYYGRGPFGEAE